jgi:hypothetical protein
MNRFILSGFLVAAGIGSSVYAQEAAGDSAKAPATQQVAPGSQDEQTPAAKSTEEKLSELKQKLDGLDEPLSTLNSTVDKLNKFKISGYIYAQARYTPDFDAATDTTKTGKKGADERTYGYSIGDFAGGALPTRESSQLQLREARLKLSYETEMHQAVLQMDFAPVEMANTVTAVTSTYDTAKKTVTNTYTNGNPLYSKGGVTVKDAYYRFTEPWLKSISLQGGIFDRPYGFELHYSSSARETPERSRLEQTLFPNERDLGFMVEYIGADNLPTLARYLTFKGGIFTGNGINVETDNNRDFIGRLGASIPLNDINLAIDLGASGYVGNIQALNDSLYEVTNNAWAGTKGHLRENVKRQYYGGDAEIYFGNTPVIGGTCLRVEATQGKQPCYGNSSSKSFASNVVSTSPVYLRNVQGYYVTLVQNIDPLKSQIALRYDSFDPNTDIAGSDVKSLADVQFNTIGGGWIYHWNENVKFMLYYEMVQNEKCPNLTVGKVTATNGTVTAAGYNYGDVLKNDILTFRIQYKF